MPGFFMDAQLGWDAATCWHCPVANLRRQWLNDGTMKSLADIDVKSSSFWLRHPDPTQAAVHLALQWLAYVYPASELHLEATLRQALPYADPELSKRWRDFLEEKGVDDHVEALRWLSKTLSREQVPFLVESCWRLLLVSHDMPSHVPLALRLMGRILDVPEFEILDIGQQVQRETQGEAEENLAPLLPEDPRYLDRVEWRLYGVSDPVRRNYSHYEKPPAGRSWAWLGLFMAGVVFGAGVLAFLVWGPLQLGRQTIPRMSHLVMESSGSPNSRDSGPAPAIEPFEPNAESSVEQSKAPEAPNLPQEPAVEPDSSLASESDAAQAPTAEVQEEPEPNLEQAPAKEILMTITASVLNVRAEPSLDAEIVMKLGDGAEVWVDPSKSEGFWQQVRVGDTVGYASGRYMTPADE